MLGTYPFLRNIFLDVLGYPLKLGFTILKCFDCNYWLLTCVDFFYSIWAIFSRTKYLSFLIGYELSSRYLS